MIEKLAFGLYDLSKKLQNQILLKEFQIAKELFWTCKRYARGLREMFRF